MGHFQKTSYGTFSFNDDMHEHFSKTNLKRFRTTIGCTQAELAKRSGVSLRSIQMYEQRNKDINKASAESLYRISKILRPVRMEFD